MIEEEMEFPVKVLIVGNGAVGKSSMIQRYCKGIYTDAYKKTIGVDFLEKKIEVNGYDLRLMIWDTAGQEEFDSMTQAYYRDAEACVVAFSTTDKDSFDAVEGWIKKVEDQCGSIPMVLVQNKIDLMDQAMMTKEEAESKADKVKLKFFRTSVQQNFKVNEVFDYLCGLYVEKLKKREAEAAGSQKTQIGGGAKLEPVKQRTGGKKSGLFSACVLL